MAGPVTLVTATLNRVAQLIESGKPPAKALRQACEELEEMEKAYWGRPVPDKLVLGEKK